MVKDLAHCFLFNFLSLWTHPCLCSLLLFLSVLFSFFVILAAFSFRNSEIRSFLTFQSYIVSFSYLTLFLFVLLSSLLGCVSGPEQQNFATSASGLFLDICDTFFAQSFWSIFCFSKTAPMSSKIEF